ncbi:hypothetical protein Ancab_001977 [Ancistrocladus abbreviatus]
MGESLIKGKANNNGQLGGIRRRNYVEVVGDSKLPPNRSRKMKKEREGLKQGNGNNALRARTKEAKGALCRGKYVQNANLGDLEQASEETGELGCLQNGSEHLKSDNDNGESEQSSRPMMPLKLSSKAMSCLLL